MNSQKFSISNIALGIQIQPERFSAILNNEVKVTSVELVRICEQLELSSQEIRKIVQLHCDENMPTTDK